MNIYQKLTKITLLGILVSSFCLPAVAQTTEQGACNTQQQIKTYNLIKRYYETFNNSDIKAFLSLLTDDVQHNVNQGDTEIGKEAFAKFMNTAQKHYSEKLSNMVIFVNNDGTRAAAEFTDEGKYIATDKGLPPAHGQVYRLSVGEFFTIRDGKISRETTYYNLKDWMQQVGAK